jgi:hypothetical protein
MSQQYGGRALTRTTLTRGIFLFIRLAIASAVAIVWQGLFEPAAMAVTALTSSYQWQFVGPEPMSGEVANFGGSLLTGFPNLTATGRVTAIAADPQVSGRVFVGTAGGGVWMATNNLPPFTLISASLPSQAIGAIAIDPVNTTPTTIYVATGEGNNSGDSYYGQGIFKSTNLGNTWTPILPVGYPVPGSSEVLGHPSFTKLAIDTSHNPPYLLRAPALGSASIVQEWPSLRVFQRTTACGARWTEETPGTTMLPLLSPAVRICSVPVQVKTLLSTPHTRTRYTQVLLFSVSGGHKTRAIAGSKWRFPGYQECLVARASQ